MMKTTADLVVEWSPRGTTIYDRRTQSTSSELSDFSGRSAILALGRRAVFIKHVRLPNTTRSEMEQVLHLRLPELFAVGGSDLAFDFLTYDDVNEQGRLCLVAAVRVEDLRAALSLMESRRIQVTQVLPVAVASPTVASKLGIARAAVVWPVAEGFGVDVVDEGKLLASRVVTDRDGLESDICVAFTLAGIACSPILVGGGLLLSGADRSIAGDARQPLISEPIPINIELPEVVAKRKGQARQAKSRFTLMLALATAFLGIYLYSDYNDAVAKASIEAGKDAKRIQRLTALSKSAEVAASDLAGTEAILTRTFNVAQPLTDAAAAATEALPTGVWLTGLSVERGKEMQIRGVGKSSQSVSDYVRNLSELARFRNVRLVFANDSTIDEAKVVQFSVSAFPIGNLPLLDTAKRGGK